MRLRDRLILVPCLLMCASMSPSIWADSDDVQGSHDYPGWTRMPGFAISDYDEDNPAEFTFSVSKPLPGDANNLEAMPVEGHRYVIRYEWSDTSQPPSLLRTQRHYEKLAAAQGYKVEKSGAVGNVTETFHLSTPTRQVWVYLNPSVRVNMLTVVESRAIVSPTMAAMTPPPPSAPASVPAPAPAPAPPTPVAVNPVPAPAPPVTPSPPLTAADDPLGTELLQNGRVVLPLTFLPGKPDLDVDSQPVINRVVAILKLHPELSLTIEGHTDLTGDEQANLLLSKKRAQTVRELLIEGHIRSRRLVAVGLGGTLPVADEGTAEGREKNRRIELVVRKGGVKKEAPAKDVSQEEVSPPIEPGGDSSFHAPAPDGVNYYPSAASSTAAPSTPTTRSTR